MAALGWTGLLFDLVMAHKTPHLVGGARIPAAIGLNRESWEIKKKRIIVESLTFTSIFFIGAYTTAFTPLMTYYGDLDAISNGRLPLAIAILIPLSICGIAGWDLYISNRRY